MASADEPQTPSSVPLPASDTPGADASQAVTVAPPEQKTDPSTERIQLPSTEPKRAPRPYDPESTIRWARGLDTVLVLLVLVLAGLLASFPARNSDLWRHLGTGRYLASELGQGHVSFTTDPFTYTATGAWVNHSWLSDLIGYGIFKLLGGVGLIAVKVLLVLALAGALLLAGRSSTSDAIKRSWWLAAIGAALALVVVGPWLELRPVCVSFLFLALTLWLLERPRQGAQTPSLGDYWPLLVLFVLWVNLDAWFLLGPLTVALYAIGQLIPRSSTEQEFQVRPGEPRVLGLVLVAGLLACLLNPAHVYAFRLPSGLIPASSALAQDSAFKPLFYGLTDFDYFTSALGLSGGSMAFFVLALALIGSFILVPAALSTWRSVVCGALLVLTIWNVAFIPFFAIVAGPVLALNLRSFLVTQARQPEHREASSEAENNLEESSLLGRWLTIALGAVLLATAWPGWLQPAPFGPRRWKVLEDPSLKKAAEQLRLWHQADSPVALKHGFILSPAAADYFAWACPEEKNLCDLRLTTSSEPLDDFFRVRKALTEKAQHRPGELEDNRWRADVAEVFRKYDIDHLILYTDQEDLVVLSEPLQRVWTSVVEWPAIHQTGRCLVFGWEGLNPQWRLNSAVKGRFADLRINWDSRAYDPAQVTEAPAEGLRRDPQPRRLCSSFVSAPTWRSADQDEALVHLMHFDYLRGKQSFRIRSQREWLQAEAVALVGPMALATTPGGTGLMIPEVMLGSFVVMREKAFQRKEGERFSRLGFALAQISGRMMEGFLRSRDDAPPSLLYLGIRSARRALRHDPDSSVSWRVLGGAYFRLANHTRERSWYRIPHLRMIRSTQTVVALTESLKLNPDQPDVHLQLWATFEELGALDLALEHMKEFIRTQRAKGPFPDTPEERERFEQQMANLEQKKQKLEEEVERRRDLVENKAEGTRVFDRARIAQNEGLWERALKTLLESNIAAFGDQGLELELELLLRTGDVEKVHSWLDPAEHRGKLGDMGFDQIQLKVQASRGDYGAADKTLDELVRLHSGYTLTRDPKNPQMPGKDRVGMREIMTLQLGQLLLERSAQMTRSVPGEISYVRTALQVFAGLNVGQEQLSRAADLEVLRGYLELESGRVEQARSHWKQALSLWKSPADVRSGAGIDFYARAYAQHGLKLIPEPKKPNAESK